MKLVLRTEDRGRMEASQMRFLTSAMGLTLTDKTENLREQLSVNSGPIVEDTEQTNWNEHEKRTPERLPSQVYFTSPRENEK